MALWMCRTGIHGEHEQKFLEEGRIYCAWNRLKHDLSTTNYKALLVLLMEIYPNTKSPRARSASCSQIWAFASKMSPGDWVCVPTKQRTVHVGEITGKYVFVPDGEDPYYHYRTVKWLEKDIPRTNFDQDIRLSLGSQRTICQIKRHDAEARVRAMQSNEWRSTGARSTPTSDDEIATDENVPTDFDLEQNAHDQIVQFISRKFKGYGMQVLVDAILKAQGYTTYLGGKGADGGIDILAAPGMLGFGNPRLCVQVKSQDSPLERPVLDQLVGTMQHVGADQGLLVCWGGFKPTIKREEGRRFFSVRLWDRNDLIDQLLANYDKLDEDLRTRVPLKRIWTIATQEENEED